MLLATALALLITGCAQQTFTVQNKPAAVAPKETITHHFFVSGIGQKKTVDAAKICGGARNVVKTETQQTFVNGLLGFIALGIALRWKRVCIAHNNCMSCPSCERSIYCSLIYFWFASSCFCIVISLSPGVIIPFSGVCQSGNCITPEASEQLHALTDRLLYDVQPTTTSGNIITQSIIFSFSISYRLMYLHQA